MNMVSYFLSVSRTAFGGAKMLALGGCVFAMALSLSPRNAMAACACGATFDCFSNLTDADAWWNGQNWTMAQQTYFNRTLYDNFFKKDLWEDNVEPALQKMTSELEATGAATTGYVGAYFDGAQALDTQLVLQELQARAIKDYTPGENLCRLGTGVRSLAAAEEKANTAMLSLAEFGEDRMMGTKGTGSAAGGTDLEGRFKQYQRLYCDPGDNNGQMAEICGAAPNSDPVRFNKDIDYPRTIEKQLTLDIDFSDDKLKADEEDVLALGNNLYGHNVFPRLPEYAFSDPLGQNDNAYRYLDLRQIAALRSVAQTSYDAIVGMRARGSYGSGQFLRAVLLNMGMSEDEARLYLGGATAAGSGAGTVGAANGEPSYYAQMEVLTKKLYQDPNFYVNLIDKPAEVQRVSTAMQGFGLMNDWEITQSAQRQEYLLSVLLELEVREAQDAAQRDLERLGTAQGD